MRPWIRNRSRWSQTKGAQTRRAILDAAIARFGRDGYRSTSVADIARDAAVGGTVAYAYFPSKEALFLAAVDEDAAAVISQGLSAPSPTPTSRDWRSEPDLHPGRRRSTATRSPGGSWPGLEPEVTARVLEIPALGRAAQGLRRAAARPSRSPAPSGPTSTRPAIANGMVAIMLSLLMSVVQLGTDTATTYADDVAAVFEAALDPTPPRRPSGRR